LILSDDDGIVVVMTADEYLYDTDETNRPMELEFGLPREPPAPFYSHQVLVLRTAQLLSNYGEHLGQVVVAPIDVVLDREKALIVQPDVLFISNERKAIIRDQIWGAPDLVVEVLSPGTAAQDRTQKRGWYRQYGVREYWLVDPAQSQVTLLDSTGGQPVERIARGGHAVRSAVLSDLIVRAHVILG